MRRASSASRLVRLGLGDAGGDLAVVDDRGVEPGDAELRAVRQLRPDLHRLVPGVVLALPRMGAQLGVDDRLVVLPLGVALDRERRAGRRRTLTSPASSIFQSFHWSVPGRLVPHAEVDRDLLVLEGIEDDVVLGPVLRLLHGDVLVLEGAAVGQRLDFRVAGVAVGLDLHRDVVAAVLRQLQRVGEAGELRVVLHGGDAVGDLDGLVLEAELRRERDGRVGDDVGQAALHLEEGVLDREPSARFGSCQSIVFE
jgi:hypothetical protein